MQTTPLVVPPEMYDIARESHGRYFEPISGLDAETSARDFLNAELPARRARILERYAQLSGAKVLEIGSGFGTNVASWNKHFGADAYGVEPGSEGFDEGLRASRLLLEANGLDPSRIVNASGERLPFPDESFDIVYSANVLEHTEDPRQVLTEAMRVLRRGGTLHVEVPNHLSYFEGHYKILQPPLVDRRILPIWVRLLGRDAAFARTLRTEINPIWCRKTMNVIAARYPLRIVSLGEDLFLERLGQPFQFETAGVASKLGAIIGAIQALNRGNWIGRAIVAAQGHYPIYLTAKRL